MLESGCALDRNDDDADWVQEMISRTQSFSWIFQPFIVKAYLSRQAGARPGQGGFAHKLHSLEPGNIGKTTSRH